MNEEKFTSGRGGKREGAGRPKGTIKENKKKPCSFKLSEGEEKTVRRIFNDMRHDDLFRYEKQIELMNGFKPFIKSLQDKYGEGIRLSIDYETILVYGRGNKIKEKISTIINDLIKYAKKELDEEYILPIDINYPGETWSLPSKQDITYSWLLYRKLKEVDELE